MINNKTFPLISLLGLLLFSSTQAQTLTHTSTQNTGSLNFDASEFPQSVLNYPTQITANWRATFNETNINRMFMHTFRFKVPKGCKVTSGNLSIRIQSINQGSLPMNDSVGFVNNAQGIFSTSVWSQGDAANQPKMLNFDLSALPSSGSILNTMNNGKFSLYLQDDTAVKSVSLRTSVTCPDDNAGGPTEVKGEHFQCYNVKPELKLKPIELTVQDQFGKDEIVLGRPIMLCNPSAKIHNKNEYRIINKKRHLVCYSIEKQNKPRSRRVQVNNQFEGNRLRTQQRRMFCAPSLKKHLRDKPIRPQDGTLRAIKPKQIKV